MGYIEFLLLGKGRLGRLIRDHACFGETGRCKGETMRLLMERNGIAEAAYVGDTQGDLEAARLAGIPLSGLRTDSANRRPGRSRLTASPS
ncbi:MAG: hypothetical protein ACLU9S_00580 [Oscillospiraceae bacterium]